MTFATKLRRRTRVQVRERLAQAEAMKRASDRAAALAGKPAPSTPFGMSQRSIWAGDLSRTNAHFPGTFSSLDDDLSRLWKRVVARSRELAINDPYMKRFLQLASVAVIGKDGVRLQSLATGSDGERSATDQKLVERLWKDFCRRENCDIRRKRSFRDIQEGFLRGLLRDGEGLQRIVNGADNPHSLALQPLDPMLLDVDLSGKPRSIPSDHEIVMGVELDADTRPAFYWLRQPPSARGIVHLQGNYYRRLPADEVIHEFLMVERADYNRGLPAAVASILSIEMLNGALDAELTATRNGACLMGAYTREQGAAEYKGESRDGNGNLLQEAEPGKLLNLPAGVKLDMFDPKHPNSAFKDFTKLTLRGQASGLGCSYNPLANDLEGVSYGSLRNAAIEDREYWRTLQDFVIHALCERVADVWLKRQFLTGQIELSPLRFEDLRKRRWYARGFPWIDPDKEQKATRSAILETQTMSRTESLAERGIDFEEHIETLAREESLMREKGVPPSQQLNWPASEPDPNEVND